jgi:Tfp pilus assembly protein PilN
MPNINLIAERREEKRRMERLSKQLFYAIGGSLGVLVAMGSYLLTQRITLQGDVAEADNRMAKLRPVIDEIERIKKETADKKPKVDTLEKARYDTLRWTLLFQAVAQSLPKDAWLTTIGAPEGEPVVVSLAGSAPTQAMAGQVALNLKTQSLFEKVELLSTSRIEKDSRFMFQINAPIKPIALPAAPPPAEEKKTAQAGRSEGEKSRV